MKSSVILGTTSRLKTSDFTDKNVTNFHDRGFHDRVERDYLKGPREISKMVTWLQTKASQVPFFKTEKDIETRTVNGVK